MNQKALRKIVIVTALALLTSGVRGKEPPKTFEKIQYGDEVYENVTVKRATATQVTIRHKYGIATLATRHLPEEIKKDLGYDDEKVIAEQKKQNQDRIDSSFRDYCLRSRWVTHIEQDHGNNFYVRLPLEKYTSKENVKAIAEYIARAYVIRNRQYGGKHTSATVHVFSGNRVYAMGSYRN